MAVSYSGLKTFEQCPRRYYETKVIKIHPHQDTDATLYGKAVHEACELYIRDGKPLGGHSRFKSLLDQLNSINGDKHCEMELAVCKDGKAVAFDDENAKFRGIADLVIIDGTKAYVFDYKGLPLDTKIPTPTGFVTMKDLNVGDSVFALDGSVCTITVKSAVHNKPCIKLSFDDMTSIVCDEDHRWILTTGAVVSARELKVKDKIPLCSPAQYPQQTLPIDPYVLGLWLADGKHTSSEISKPDPFIWDEITRRGYSISHDYSAKAENGKCRTHTVLGIISKLRSLNVLGNKHIPDIYMHGSVAQRLALVQGIMDGDGYANPGRKQAVLSTVSLKFSNQVKTLLESLGQRVAQANVIGYGFDKTVRVYPLSFKPFGLNPFLLPRKADIVAAFVYAPNTIRNNRKIVAIESVPTVPTQCISVDSADNSYLCTETYLPTHNTGSDKYPDTAQLELMALFLMAKFPEILVVKGALLFLLHDTVIKATYHKRDELSMWKLWHKKVNTIQAVTESGVWPERSSGLCPWCPCTTCPSWKPKRS